MRRLILGTVLTAAFAVVPLAAAGGWATAGLSPPPSGTGAGDTWNAEVTLLQHGQTPLVGVMPKVIIQNGGGKPISFAATPTSKPGVYVAKVKFPSNGSWRYSVDDGFSQTHTFAAVTIGGSGGDSAFPVTTLLLGIAGALIAATALFLLIRRQRRPQPVPA